MSCRMKLLNLCFHLIIAMAVATIEEECHRSHQLGMIDHAIADWQVTASSVYPAEWEKGCSTKYGRVFERKGKAWCPYSKSQSEWLQIDLGVPAIITGFMTQGRMDGKEWVIEYLVSHSIDSSNWTYIYEQSGREKVFPGNYDAYNVKHVYLDVAIRARYLKFHPKKWQQHPSMRVEIFGCQKCKQMISSPPYATVTASSIGVGNRGARSPACKAEDGFLQSPTAWCPRKKDKRPWLEFNVGPATTISGVVTKGRKDVGKSQYVTAYHIAYSMYRKRWTYYTERDYKGKRFIVEFDGNNDRDSPRYHYFTQTVTARYVRFYPLRSQGRISMRAGVIGCPYEGECPRDFIRINSASPCTENMAFNRKAWSYTRKQYKRRAHLLPRRGDIDAERAVDGRFNIEDLNTCIPLNNYQVDDPSWLVDVGRNNEVTGVIFYLYRSNNATNQQRFSNLLKSLSRISIHVTNKPVYRISYLKDTETSFCNSLINVNNYLAKNNKVHLTCRQPLRGKFVYITAESEKPDLKFNTFLCEVMIYK